MFPGNPQLENWVTHNIEEQNKAAVLVAAADLAAYNQHIKEWEQATIQARYNNAPIPQPPKPPMITQYYDAGGWAESRVIVNPAAVPPRLPPLPAVGAPNVGIAGPGGSGAAAFDNEVLGLLRENNAMLKAIVSKLGVQ